MSKPNSGSVAGQVSATTPAHPPDAPLPRTADVELIGVYRDGWRLLAVVTDWRRTWQIDVEAKDLQSFRRFQQAALDQKDIWVLPVSQLFGSAAERRDAWLDDVAAAFKAGRPCNV